MNVAFLHVGDDSRCAEIMVRSVRGMGHQVLQMTDGTTPKVKGANDVKRLVMDEPLMPYRLKHLALLPDFEWLLLDTDIVMQKDVSKVWDKEFDVALTKRFEPVPFQGYDITRIMPYNTGVMFSRSRNFWRDAYEQCLTLDPQFWEWWGDQISVFLAARDGGYKLLELDCNEYNYSPKSQDEDVSGKAIVHYKGANRKEWMHGNHDLRTASNRSHQLA